MPKEVSGQTDTLMVIPRPSKCPHHTELTEASAVHTLALSSALGPCGQRQWPAPGPVAYKGRADTSPGTQTGSAEPLPGWLYLGQQLGVMPLKDCKRGPAEGQVTGLGFQLHGTACGWDRILGNQETQLRNHFPSLEPGPGPGDKEWVTGWGTASAGGFISPLPRS